MFKVKAALKAFLGNGEKYKRLDKKMGTSYTRVLVHPRVNH
jgi:hypothetical protein